MFREAVDPHERQASATGVHPIDELVSPLVLMSPTKATVAIGWHRQAARRSRPRGEYLTVNGVPIHTGTYASRSGSMVDALTLVDVATGHDVHVSLPGDVPLWPLGFSADGRRLAFAAVEDDGIRLWRTASAGEPARV